MKGNNFYRNGIARERQVVEYLTQLGWFAFRVPGSKGSADVVAFRRGSTALLVQVKGGGSQTRWSAFGPGERAALRRDAYIAGAEAIYVRWPPGKPMEWIPESKWPPETKVDYIEDERGCWIWQGTVTSWGYGQVQVDGRAVQAHRHYYENRVGPIPTGHFIDHLCHVRCCVNPQHLEPVTPRENARRRGDLKLTPADVQAIRRSRQSNREIAQQYGISANYAYQLKKGMWWPGLEEEAA